MAPSIQRTTIANAQIPSTPTESNKGSGGTISREIQTILLEAYANSLPSSSIKSTLVAQFKAALLSGDLNAAKQGGPGFEFKELIQIQYAKLWNNASARQAFYEALEKTSKLSELAINFGIAKLAEAIKKATDANVKAGVTSPTPPESVAPTIPTTPTTPTTPTSPATPTTPATEPQIALTDKDKANIVAASGMPLADLKRVATALQADSSEQIASASVKAFVLESSKVFDSIENNRAALEALKLSSPETATMIDQALNSQLSLQERLIALYQLANLPAAAAILGGEMQARLQSLAATGSAAATPSS